LIVQVLDMGLVNAVASRWYEDIPTKDLLERVEGRPP